MYEKPEVSSSSNPFLIVDEVTELGEGVFEHVFSRLKDRQDTRKPTCEHPQEWMVAFISTDVAKGDARVTISGRSCSRCGTMFIDSRTIHEEGAGAKEA